MIENTRAYGLLHPRTWAFLSQSRLWLKRPSGSVARTDHEALPSPMVFPGQSLQGPLEGGQKLDSLDTQPSEVHLRSLVFLCQGLTRQYQLSPEVVLEHWWWHALHQAGVHLRDNLEEMCASQDSSFLPRQEVEQAYFLLIHVAYFFEPGGIAETICKEQGWSLDAQEFERF